MEKLEGFVVNEGHAVYRPTGSVSFSEAVAMVRAAIAMARTNHALDLLVDSTALSGFQPPMVSERFLAAVEWAREAHGNVRMVIVARPEMIDPQKFGMLVAANRGLTANIFATEAEARAWLESPDKGKGA